MLAKEIVEVLKVCLADRTLEICLATRQDLNVLRGFLLKDASTFMHINFLTLLLLIFVILVI